jgi:uncharacterized membrane protein YhaH (DUF805 family)
MAVEPARRPEARLGFVLAVAAAVCFVVGNIAHDETWGSSLSAAGLAAFLTSLVLVMGSERRKNRGLRRAAALLNPAAVTGLLGAELATGVVHFFGGLAGVIAVLLLWAATAPSRGGFRYHWPQIS